MRKLNTVIKDGTVDYIFGECEFKRKIIDTLLSIYKKWGYSEIMTPVIEYKDVFSGYEVGEMVKEENIYTFSDEKNRRIAIRPDCTMPIARVAASKLKNSTAPFRLCYSQTTVKANAMPLESTQSGVELIGETGISADTEILVLAAKCLAKTDESFRIELGYGLLFSTLIEEYAIAPEIAEKAKEHIERKNFAALEAMELPEAIKKLPRYFGGVEVLDSYALLAPSDSVKKMLDYLKQLYSKLSECGFAEHIDFDLGIVNSLDYYTGIIFRGYVTDSGTAVLSGGRYDNLLEKYGTAFPAIGFGINVDSVFEAKKYGETADSIPDVLVNSAPDCEAKAFAEADALTEKGISVMFSYTETEAEALNEAKVRGIKKVVRLTSQGRTEYDV